MDRRPYIYIPQEYYRFTNNNILIVIFPLFWMCWIFSLPTMYYYLVGFALDNILNWIITYT